jgi:hypothetical protein
LCDATDSAATVTSGRGPPNLPSRWANRLLSAAFFVAIFALGLGSASPISHWSPLGRNAQGVFDPETALVGSASELHPDLFESSADSDGFVDLIVAVPCVLSPRVVERGHVTDPAPAPPSRARAHDGECCRE